MPITPFVVSAKNKIWTGALCALVIVEFASIMVYYAEIQSARLFSQLDSRGPITVERIMNALMCFTDLSLAGSLVFLLRRLRSGFTRTDAVVKSIIAYFLYTSLVTAVVACLSLIFAIVFPHSLLYLALDILISKRKCCP